MFAHSSEDLASKICVSGDLEREVIALQRGGVGQITSGTLWCGLSASNCLTGSLLTALAFPFTVVVGRWFGPIMISLAGAKTYCSKGCGNCRKDEVTIIKVT